MYSMKRKKLFSLYQGDMTLSEYEVKFLILLAFVGEISLLEATKARLYKESLNPRI